jgi:pimeloyl-ACP methyl ester carboxylesterase
MAGQVAYSTLEKAILHRLAESTGRAVDIAYASIVHQLGITQQFFAEGGFGDLRVVDFHEELKTFQSWPPEHFDDVKIDWRRVREGNYNSHAYTVLRANFPTLTRGPAYDAMPIESRTAHALWIVPHQPAPGSPTAVHLAATGDHGFARREHLSIPLIARGIGSLALESPFYGIRKPKEQQGAKLRRVSDLILLGKATIEESLFLLRWLSLRGHTRLGVSGLSMGGVHASMVAALYPEPLALAPLLAPRSAAQSYCQGALFHATAWDTLLRDTEGREAEIVDAVKKAAVAHAKMAAAKIKRDALEGRTNSLKLSLAGVENQSTPREKQRRVAGTSVDSAAAAAAVEEENAQQQGHWSGVGRWMSEWGHSLENQLRKVRRLESTSRGNTPKNSESGDRHAAAVLLLEAVLETFTDATRFPCPRRPDAAVLVAATEDAYVSPQSVLDLHRHLPGSEIRWIPGGHVSSFLMHQPTFRNAIVDSLDKLNTNNTTNDSV